MGAVDVIILHPLPAPGAGPLERALADARSGLAEDHRVGFGRAGAATVRIVAGDPDDRPFGKRLHELVDERLPDRGLILMGSGAIPLATASDRRAFVRAASADDRRALANNRFSADVVALSASAAAGLADLPSDFPADNALPRWLAEVGGITVADLRARWRLAMDLDSPLDVILVAGARRRSGTGPAARLPRAAMKPAALQPAADRIHGRLDAIRRVLGDPRAELVVAGRTSAATVGWLERNVRCRVRALVEERGLRAASPLAQAPLAQAHGPAVRRPRSILGMLLDRDGPSALGARLAELGDAALVDSRVLLADRSGPDEATWPAPGARFASDLLDAAAVDDPWLAAVTASAAAASIPVLLGGHSLVGPGIRLIAGGT